MQDYIETKLPLKISNLFKNSIINNRLSHAYLFNWQHGLINYDIPFFISKTILCLNKRYTEIGILPCNVCDSCKKFDANTHPDLLVVEPEGSFIKINQIRDIISNFSFSPFYHKRICIIKECHRFNLEAANTILKILEEPPQNNLFFLCTNQADALLSTIISRCIEISVPHIFELTGHDLNDLGISDRFLRLMKYIGISNKEQLLGLRDMNFFPLREEIIHFILKKDAFKFLILLGISDKITEHSEIIPFILKLLLTINRDFLLICNINHNYVHDLLNPELMDVIGKKIDIFPDKLWFHHKWLMDSFYLLDRNVSKSLIIEKSLAFYMNIFL